MSFMKPGNLLMKYTYRYCKKAQAMLKSKQIVTFKFIRIVQTQFLLHIL